MQLCIEHGKTATVQLFRLCTGHSVELVVKVHGITTYFANMEVKPHFKCHSTSSRTTAHKLTQTINSCSGFMNSHTASCHQRLVHCWRFQSDSFTPHGHSSRCEGILYKSIQRSERTSNSWKEKGASLRLAYPKPITDSTSQPLLCIAFPTRPGILGLDFNVRTLAEG